MLFGLGGLISYASSLDEALKWEPEMSQSGDGMGKVFGAESLEPFACNDITLFHRHAGVLAEHLGATSPSPGQKS